MSELETVEVPISELSIDQVENRLNEKWNDFNEIVEQVLVHGTPANEIRRLNLKLNLISDERQLLVDRHRILSKEKRRKLIER
jgi:Trp operon repressor